MAGRNDRRRAANLRSSRKSSTRSSQSTRSTGTSRPVANSRTARSSRSSASTPAKGQALPSKQTRRSEGAQRQDRRREQVEPNRTGYEPSSSSRGQATQRQRGQRQQTGTRQQAGAREQSSERQASARKQGNSRTQRTARQQAALDRIARQQPTQQRPARSQAQRGQGEDAQRTEQRSKLLSGLPRIGSRKEKVRDIARIPSPIEGDEAESESPESRSGSSRRASADPSSASAERQRPVERDEEEAPAEEATDAPEPATRRKSPEVKATRGGASKSSKRADGKRARKGKDAEAEAEADEGEEELDSKTVAQLRRADRRERAKKNSRRLLMRVVGIIGIVVALLAGWAALYNSPAFSIENVEVNGVEHLTSDEMSTMANVPSDTTLLRVDTATIENRIKQNAWVSDVHVVRAFPSTLQINVVERQVYAVVEIPTTGMTAVKQWAISNDHLWLMPIPDADSEAAKTTSAKVYEDAQRVLHIIDLPIGTKAEIGKECVDANVNNALDVVAGLTTDLANRVAEVSAAGTAETTLILDNGVEIAFGKAEDIRDKERVILQILEEHPNNVAYINVRMPETPTWRAV